MSNPVNQALLNNHIDRVLNGWSGLKNGWVSTEAGQTSYFKDLNGYEDLITTDKEHKLSITDVFNQSAAILEGESTKEFSMQMYADIMQKAHDRYGRAWRQTDCISQLFMLIAGLFGCGLIGAYNNFENTLVHFAARSATGVEKESFYSLILIDPQQWGVKEKFLQKVYTTIWPNEDFE